MSKRTPNPVESADSAMEYLRQKRSVQLPPGSGYHSEFDFLYMVSLKTNVAVAAHGLLDDARAILASSEEEATGDYRRGVATAIGRVSHQLNLLAFPLTGLAPEDALILTAAERAVLRDVSQRLARLGPVLSTLKERASSRRPLVNPAGTSRRLALLANSLVAACERQGLKPPTPAELAALAILRDIESPLVRLAADSDAQHRAKLLAERERRFRQCGQALRRVRRTTPTNGA